jgi:hypothetical protein
MSKMVRKQIYIYKRQEAWIKGVAQAKGVSEAEVIRQAIDRQLSGDVTPRILGTDALEAFIQFALSRREAGIQGKPYRWRRSDAYGEAVRF